MPDCATSAQAVVTELADFAELAELTDLSKLTENVLPASQPPFRY